MSLLVLLDSCTLIPMPLADLLLRLADLKVFRPAWSEDILQEVERNLVLKIHIPPEKASRRVSVMREHFPDAMANDFHGLMPGLTCEDKDRHVLAAGIRAKAKILMTYNLRDFPIESLAPYDIQLAHPDAFLCDQLASRPKPLSERWIPPGWR